MAQGGYKFPKVPGPIQKPVYPKVPGEGYRRQSDGNDINLGNGQFEARIRPLSELGTGLRPQEGYRPPPLWTQFLCPKDYSWLYSEQLTAIDATVTQQTIDTVTIPGTLALIVLEWTPLLMRPKPGVNVLKEFTKPEEYATQIVAQLAVGGKAPLSSSITLTQGSGTVQIAGTRFMNRRAFIFDPGTFPVVVYGSAGESTVVTFTYTAAAQSNGMPGSGDLSVGSILLGITVPISTLDRLIEYMRIT